MWGREWEREWVCVRGVSPPLAAGVSPPLVHSNGRKHIRHHARWNDGEIIDMEYPCSSRDEGNRGVCAGVRACECWQCVRVYTLLLHSPTPTRQYTLLLHSPTPTRQCTLSVIALILPTGTLTFWPRGWKRKKAIMVPVQVYQGTALTAAVLMTAPGICASALDMWCRTRAGPR
jgi:hypothetical protein